MTRKNVSIGFVAGLIAGLVAAFLLSGVPTVRKVMAQGYRREQHQPPLQPMGERYRISTWAYPAGSIGTQGSGSQAQHGAYVLDSWTGKVWEIRENGKPQSLGDLP